MASECISRNVTASTPTCSSSTCSSARRPPVVGRSRRRSPISTRSLDRRGTAGSTSTFPASSTPRSSGGSSSISSRTLRRSLPASPLPGPRRSKRRTGSSSSSPTARGSWSGRPGRSPSSGSTRRARRRPPRKRCSAPGSGSSEAREGPFLNVSDRFRGVTGASPRCTLTVTRPSSPVGGSTTGRRPRERPERATEVCVDAQFPDRQGRKG